MLLELWTLIRVNLGQGREALSAILSLTLSTLYWVAVAAILTAVVASII